MVRPRYPAHHSGIAWAVLAHHNLGQRVGSGSGRHASLPRRRVVSKEGPDLQRRHRRRPPRAVVVSTGLFDVTDKGRYRRNAPPLAQTIPGDSVPCSLRCGKSSLVHVGVHFRLSSFLSFSVLKSVRTSYASERMPESPSSRKAALSLVRKVRTG